MKYSNHLLRALKVASLIPILAFSPAKAEDAPVAIDSRIRTLVYSANEVFKMYTKYGYQSNIEFGEKEQIATISLGLPSAFKITPAGNRLFVKALQKGRHTNMTVLTTKRAYQFELFSDSENDDRVIYVMRFYYPEEHIDEPVAPAPDAAGNPAEVPAEKAGAAPVEPAPEPEKPMPVSENYNYSLTGPEAISPVRVYDTGAATYFQFAGASVPGIYGVNPDGTEYPLNVRTEGQYLVVDTVLRRFSVRQGSEVVCVFNESLPQSPVPQALIPQAPAR